MRLKMPPKPIPYIRIVIIKDGRAKKGDKVIALEETTLQECYNYFKTLIYQQILIEYNVDISQDFVSKDLITIELREYIGTKAGKSKQFSFRGLTPNKVEKTILNNIK